MDYSKGSRISTEGISTYPPEYPLKNSCKALFLCALQLLGDRGIGFVNKMSEGTGESRADTGGAALYSPLSPIYPLSPILYGIRGKQLISGG